MGRKNNNKRQNAKPVSIPVYGNKKEMDRMIQKVLNLCVQPTSKATEWTNFVEIYDLIERIRQQQKSKREKTHSRENFLPAFKSWLKDNDVITSQLEIKDCGNGEFGVKATEDIKQSDLLTTIPEKVMFTAENALQSEYFSDFVHSQKVLENMSNVRLALYLHCEKHSTDSFYKPYFDILPEQYNTSLYFSKEEMEYLKGSSAFSQAIYQYKSIARQYAIFFNLFHTEKSTQNIQAVSKIPQPARNEFTFDAYRWAVSTVTTRQNRIPLTCHDSGNNDHHSQSFTLGLIPMWDMFNHSVGQMSTDYDTENKSCNCYAMQDFKKDEEVTICYGRRSNAEFLVHNGFVFENNPFDRVDIQLGVSQNDSLFKLKSQLLARLNISPSGTFSVLAISSNMPLSKETLGFLRVFHMNEETLKYWMKIENLEVLLDVYSQPKGLEDQKVWKYMEDRLKLLLMSYKTEEQYLSMLNSEEISNNGKLGVKLQMEAKKVLTTCMLFCSKFANATFANKGLEIDAGLLSKSAPKAEDRIIKATENLTVNGNANNAN